jgi:type I restriction enzyme M protein
VFSDIRNHLAGNFKGITRDKELVEQLIFLLFCKMQDEVQTPPNHPVIFQITSETESSLVERLDQLFTKLKRQFNDILSEKDSLVIDEPNLQYVVLKLQPYAISEASRDAIGDAFEHFILPSLRGSQGQFFTPRNIAQTIAQILDPLPNESVIDPACGTGGFLTGVASLFPDSSNIPTLFGIDKDEFLVKVSQLHLAILNITNSRIYCENSLDICERWNDETQQTIILNNFDVVLTNPPFGVKIPISDHKVLQKYELAYKWIKKDNNWIKSKKLKERLPPQVLFIERCLQLLKPGGRMGIVLPDGIFGNINDRYIIDYILQNFTILAIISCSHLTFMPHTHIKTSLLFIEKTPPKNDYPIFAAIADKIGHDKNGKTLYLTDENGTFLLNEDGDKIIHDDFPSIVKNYQKYKKGDNLVYSSLGFILHKQEIIDGILIPAYYNPAIKFLLQKYQDQDYTLISIKDLINSGMISIARGHEVGAKYYGTGTIPFVRTSDIINLEINNDPLKQVSQEIYEQYRSKQDIQQGDILFVNDGTYLIGRTAMVSSEETEIIIQSHLKKIRVIKEEIIDKYLLLWSLNTNIVQKQIKSKIFIQATISTLGNRLEELILVIPKDESEKKHISDEFRAIIHQKHNSKAQYKQLIKRI